MSIWPGTSQPLGATREEQGTGMVRGLVTDDSHIPPLEPAETNEDQRALVSETCDPAISP
jgi:hypothetical protein